MLPSELKEMIDYICKIKSESTEIEVKAAHVDCPKRLYDTLSSFSNREDGGVIVFGIDEDHDFKKVGVYDAQDLQKKVSEQCKQMEPPVRPLFTILCDNDMIFVSAEIPSIDVAERPCYYKGKGIFRGSYIRVGDADELMTDYEVYSYEAFRKKYADDVRVIERASFIDLNQELIDKYIARLKTNKPNLAQLEHARIYELMSVTRNHQVTMTTLLLFCYYPQAFCPQLGIIATVVPGVEMGQESPDGNRFLDNKRIDGNVLQMLDDTISFIIKNMRVKTMIDATTGRRIDKTEYPVKAVRECLLNALVHRDYSIHTEGMPIQVIMFKDRLEISNPGGLYGRIQINQLGKIQADTRNPVLANAMEVLGITENRYAGIPTIYREMQEHGLPEPRFSDERGCFVVRLFNDSKEAKENESVLTDKKPDLFEFCAVPRSRQEIAHFLNLESVTYAIKKHILPLVAQGLILMTIPDKPGSKSQRYVSAKRSY